MLKNAFFDVYNKFKLHFYQEIFQRFQGREASLTTVETFCMEAIQALQRPTINEFAVFMGSAQDSVSEGPPGVSSGGYPEVHGLLQCELVLCGKGHGTNQRTVFPGGMHQAGADASDHQPGADARGPAAGV